MKDLKDTKALQDSQEMLLLDQELLKRNVKDLAATVQASQADIKAELGATQMEIKTQLAAFMEIVKQAGYLPEGSRLADLPVAADDATVFDDVTNG